jgi:hypothetical protein
VFVYSALLPGITNVTDRAWHFGFYPWFVRAFAQRRPNATETEFREALRRADCLATLVSARHAIVEGDEGQDDRQHGVAFPGRLKLVPAARLLAEGGSIWLSDYTERSEENPHRYFKNALGGLGQYYLGVLRDEYHALAGDPRNGIKYTNEIGLPLGAAFAEGLDEDAFLTVVDEGEVTAAILDGLAAFCPCALHERREIARRHLANMILASDAPVVATGQVRRLTFCLALDLLAGANGTAGDDEAEVFLAACYSSALPTGNPWQLSDRLVEIRRQWGIYLRNEMLSLAWESIFKASLEAVDGVLGLPGIREAANWCVGQPVFTAALAEFGHSNFREAVAEERNLLPSLAAWQEPMHELMLRQELLEDNNAGSVVSAMRMFVGLVARHGTSTNCYAPFGLSAGTLADYPLNLDTMGKAAAGRWLALDSRDWLRTLIASALSAHQRVAIRKLGQSGEDTLMFRIGDDGLFVERRMEEVAETQPRLTQAFQILRDLGLTVPTDGDHLPELTAFGQIALEEMRNG